MYNNFEPYDQMMGVKLYTQVNLIMMENVQN